MNDLESLIEFLKHQHWTQEQKALAAAVGMLGALRVLMETGLPIEGTLNLLSKVPNPLRTRRDGVSLGRIFLSDQSRVRHTHMIGPPGSGKTELTKLLCFEDIRRGRGCFIIDPKGDRELYDEVRGFCRSIGREKDLTLLSATFPEESATWNPCGLGNASELQSKFLNSNVYSEAHYAKACELGLLEAFNELTLRKPSGFALPDLARELNYLAKHKKSKDLDGLFYDLESLSKSEWGPVLGSDPASDPSREISLLNIIQNNQILFVHLPTEGKSIQSSRIGRLLTQEIILISGLRKSYPELNQGGVFSVFIDEFDAFATDSFVTFLNKGRSSNFMIHIAHQTLSDLKKINPEFAGQILGNCNIHVVFRQDNPEEAEFWAKFFGTKKTVKQTYQTQNGATTGTSSNRESQEFHISPNTIRELKVGQCIVSAKTQALQRLVKLPLPPKFAKGESVQRTMDLEKRCRARTGPLTERTQAQEARELSLGAFEPESSSPTKPSEMPPQFAHLLQAKNHLKPQPEHKNEERKS